MQGRIAVVTGGARGIGRAIVDRFAAEGATVVIGDLTDPGEVGAGIGSAGHREWVPLDVTDEASVFEFAQSVEAGHGGVDVLVNNAGIYSSLEPKPFEELEVEDWRALFDVNVVGQFLACKAVVPAMKSQGGGRIINISSGTPFKGVPFMLHYVASKGAINAMTKALAKELGGAGILVNGVAPGFTLSDGVRANPVQLEKLQEISLQARVLARDQQPDDIVGAVTFLASEDAAFMTGQTLVVDGGAYFH